MKVVTFLSDLAGPAQLTVIQPHRELRRFGVITDVQVILASEENMPGTSEGRLINQISRYDLVIVQRITSLSLMMLIRKACDILGKPMCYLLDDDYRNLEPYNPCYFSTSLHGTVAAYRKLMMEGREMEAEALVPQLEAERVQGQKELTAAWELPDCVITTTEELADVIRPYNKNIHVFPNQMERVYWERDYTLEQPDENGVIGSSFNDFGLGCVPAFWQSYDPKTNLPLKLNRIPRIGYSGTSTHKEDFAYTIGEPLNKIFAKYGPEIWWVCVGDQFFTEVLEASKGRRHPIPPTQYDIYLNNLRNIDIGLAPLLPNPFNMSKSDLKALEYSIWGACPLLPKFITYTRSFKHGENCLFYETQQEFYDMLEELIKNNALRRKLGNNARSYVAGEMPWQNGVGRLEAHHSERRFNLYDSLVKGKMDVALKCFTPGVPANA